MIRLPRMQAGLGVHLAAAGTLTEAQLRTFYTAMPDPWRDGAKVVTNTATLFAIQDLLIATPRLGDIGMVAPPAASGSQWYWMGLPLYLNSNWPTLAAAGDAVEVITMVHPDAVVFVERKSLEIKADPYGNAVNGRTRFYPSARFNIACPIPLGVVHLTDHA
jgi:HK97 family phage major capsid protein